ncbi:MAG: hypothetical protein D6706_17940 [Chloroflexi bacterium]|nr:MAG: hypothetical protein D6706_17940 [Chloroflexota bacterium]
MARKKRTTRKNTGQKTTPEKPTLTAEEKFQQEYAYVIRDLRQIFILAGAMFTLLIILNLVLR